SKRATLIGVGDSGPLAILVAATYPDRVSSLVLINTGARLVRGDDYPWGLSREEVDRFLERTRETWGTGGRVDVFSPSTDGGARPARDVDRVLATVLLTDMVGSTDRAAELGDRRWRAVLDAHDAVVRAELEQFRGKLHRTTGDGILATFDGPARGIRCAFGIRDELRSQGIEIRAGLHTGEIELRESEIGGIAVHIAAR